MFAKSAILLLYIACLVLLGGGITCCVLTGRKTKTKLNRALTAFQIGLLAMCLYDMGIYYCNYVIGVFSSMEVMRIGNCIIAVTIFLWITVQEQIVRKDSLKLLSGMVKKYLLFYAGLWLLLTIATSVEYFYTMKWLLLATDIILIVAALAASIAYIIYAAADNQRRNMYFMTVGTALLLWNYISYFWGETSVYWGNSDFIRAPLDLTIVFWLVISGITMTYVYRELFVKVFLSRDDDQCEEVALKEKLEDRIESVCSQYGLTAREKDLVELIYSGRTNKEIAEQLFLSESTVKTHIYNIFRKMEVKNRVEVTCVINGESINHNNEE